MLYPLSYEGLTCTFALDIGRISVRWVGLAISLPTVCAAPASRAVGQPLTTAPNTRRRLYGWWR